MNKRGKTLKVLGIALLIIIFLVIITAVYFYFFHVFYTYRLCVSNQVEDLEIPCTTKQECINAFLERMNQEQKTQIESLPELAKVKLEEAYDSAILCQQTCKEKEIYGGGMGGIKEVSACQPDETEIKLEIRGKEGLQLYGYLRENNLI